MKRTKEQVPDSGPIFKPGDCAVTPDGVTTIIINVGETGILVRFEPGETLGIYPHGVLRPHEKEVS